MHDPVWLKHRESHDSLLALLLSAVATWSFCASVLIFYLAEGKGEPSAKCGAQFTERKHYSLAELGANSGLQILTRLIAAREEAIFVVATMIALAATW